MHAKAMLTDHGEEVEKNVNQVTDILSTVHPKPSIKKKRARKIKKRYKDNDVDNECIQVEQE